MHVGLDYPVNVQLFSFFLLRRLSRPCGENPESAAYVEEWDIWRESGAKVVPCYGDFEQDVFKIQQTLMTGGVEFGGNFETVLGRDKKKVTMLIAGLTGEETMSVLQIFSTNKGVPKEQILVMPDFAIKKKKN